MDAPGDLLTRLEEQVAVSIMLMPGGFWGELDRSMEAHCSVSRPNSESSGAESRFVLDPAIGV
jgi:hypothetical protein